MIQKKINIEIQRMKKIAWAISFVWLFILLSSLMWNLYTLNTHTKEIAQSEARANFNKDQAIRFWATNHGGVYVPLNERTPANLSLSHIPDRNIVKPNGDTLTLMNPAYMIRQMFDEYPLEYGTVGRIVSLKPLNPNNAPDEWERKALLSFEKGENECFEFTEINGEEYLRLIQPMITKKGCLKCHAFQGYKVGDVRGGVGVSIKMSPLLQANAEERNTLIFFYLLILFVGFVGLWGGAKRHIKQAKEKLEADELLNKSEEKVNALFLEINRRKKAEELLQESEEKFHSLFLEMSEGVYLHEVIYNQKGEAVDYRIIETNSASEKQLNIKSEDANGKLATELYGTEEAPYLDVYSKVAETGIPFQFEEYFQPLKKHFHISVYSPKKGKFATIFLDITKRKLADSLLKETYEKIEIKNEELQQAKLKAEESEAQFKNLFEQHSAVMLLVEPNTGLIINANQAAIRFYGYTKSEICKICIQDINKLNHEQVEIELLNSVNYRRNNFIFSHKLSSGEERTVEVYSTPIDYEGKEILFSIIHDISERKRQEKELLKAKEKAEESDRLKSAFLANMSHEIRTPMNGILGFVDLLAEPNLGQIEIDKYSTIINKSGDRLLNTINDIIDISKIEAGEIVISKSETSINKLLDELHSFHLSDANYRGLQLFLNPVLPEEQAIVITDSHKLHGILTNLIKNAIKYTEQGHITFGYFLKGDFVEFYVQDTGIGIPQDRIRAIFNRFEQADIGDKRAFEGSGLGLAISKAYAEMLGGEISVESEEGQGSTFKFTIPYVKKAEKEAEHVIEKRDTDYEGIKKLNVLIVEDDDVSTELLKMILIGMFKNIIFVDNGFDAIEMCRKKPEIDLVLMDIKMPGMDGHFATKEIRKFNKDIIIIAQTAYALLGDKQKAIDAGCNDYIQKPINKDLLLKMINGYFGHS